MEIVHAKAADGSVGGLLVKARGHKLRHLAPGFEASGRDVLPRLAAIAGELDIAVVGANPDRIHVIKRRRNGIDRSAMRVGARRVGRHVADAGGQARMLARKVRADRLPGMAAVYRL